MIEAGGPCMPASSWIHVVIVALQVLGGLATAVVAAMVHKNGTGRDGPRKRFYH